MRLLRYHAYGGPDVLVVDDVPEPEPGPGLLAVAVEVVGVGWPVVKGIAAGDPAALPGAPAGEICGTVTAVGEGVDPGWRGRRVAGVAFSGACADVALLSVAVAVEVPDDVDTETAVALVRGGQVALGVLEAGAYRDARRILVSGAAGGVGHLAVQLAGGEGRVVTAAVHRPTPARVALLGELGAEEVVGYDDAWDPVDLVVDGVGGAVQQRALAALADSGRLVVYNAVGGPVDTNQLRMRSQVVVGFSMAGVVRHAPETFRRRARDMWEHVRRGRLRARVETFPLERAADAHALLHRRETVGRCALRLGPAR